MTPLERLLREGLEPADFEQAVADWTAQAHVAVQKDLEVSFAGAIDATVVLDPLGEAPQCVGPRVSVPWVLDGRPIRTVHDQPYSPTDQGPPVHLVGLTVVHAVQIDTDDHRILDGDVPLDGLRFQRYTDWLDFYRQLGVTLAPRTVAGPTVRPPAPDD